LSLKHFMLDQIVKEIKHAAQTLHFQGRSFSLTKRGRPNPKKGRL
jgi:hypothetical protein